MPGVFLLLMIIIPFFPSKYLYLLLPSLISLHWLGLSLQCWIGMVRRDILALFLTLVWQHLSSHYKVWCFTCIFRCCIWSWGNACLYLVCWEFLWWMGVGFYQMIFFPSSVDPILWLSSLDYCYYDLWLPIFKCCTSKMHPT